RRQHAGELRTRLLRARDDDARRTAATELALELVRDLAQVLLSEGVHVPLVVRLRPPTLIVPTGLLLGAVGDRLQASVSQLVQLAALASDGRDEDAVGAPDERDERSEEELVVHLHRVGH